MADTITSQWFAANPYQPPKPKPKQKGRGGTLTSLISEGGAVGGAAAGAAVGSVVPVVGTAIGGIIGGTLGAFGGRLAENKVRDNRYGVSEAAQEGVLTGALGGAGKIAKYGAGVGGAISKGGKLEDILVSGAKTADTKIGKGVGTTNKLRTSAADRSAKGWGVKTTDKLLPDEADEVANFINTRAGNYAPVKAGAPMNQARDLQRVKSGVVKQLDTALESINRPLKPTEVKRITANLDNRLINDPDITGNTDLANKFKTLVANKDVKGLEKLRQQYDDIAFKANGDPSTTAKAAEAMAIRDTIDEFVTPLSKEYKAIKGDYPLANKALKLASKEGGKDPKGMGLPLINGGATSNGVGGNFITANRNKLNAKMAGTGAPGVPNPTRTGLRIGAQGATLESLLTGQGSINDEMSATSPEMTNTATNTSIDETYQNEEDLSSEVETSPYTRENLMADIQRDPKNATKYIDTYTSLQEIYAPAKEKPLSAEGSKVLANANSGLTSLGQLARLIDREGVPKATVLPGRGLLGAAGANALGTAEYDTAAKNIADVITRLRTGAALTESEEAFYKSQLPQAFDKPEVIMQKMSMFNDLFQSIANRTGSSTLDDVLTSYQ